MTRALVYSEFGDRSVMSLTEVNRVVAEAGQVEVEVRAAGLNPFDVKLRSGIVPMPVEFPRCVGSDFAGTVTAVTDGSSYADGTPISVGDDVMGWIETGSMRDQAAVSTLAVTPKPESLSWELAGALSVAAQTAQACIALMNPGVGDTVVVSAAAGAVGIVYCQLALAAGARVIGTASEANHEFLRSLGVEPLSYGPGLADRLREITPEGITLAQDNWGRDFIDTALELGVPADRICTIVDHAATAELGLANPGRYERSSLTLGALAARFASGELVLPIERSFALSDFDAAFALLESRHLRGKVVVLP
jgi:NADPH:quinone reductase-like Zn-dependent oxidoreductase